MYRPRSRSPPPYRGRQYSPSRPLAAPMRSPSSPSRRYPSDSPPPRRRYQDDYPRRSPPRRYDDGYRSPPRRRYDDDQYRDRDPGSYRRSPPPPRSYEDPLSYPEPPVERYDERPPSRGMMADRVEHWVPEPRPPTIPRQEEAKWERGQDPSETEYEESAPPSAAASTTGAARARTGKQPSAPSRDVIFLGLDPQLSETDFSGYLKGEHQAQIESVKIVMDKATRQSKCFGFAAFSSIPDAEEFINNNYPAVLMPALYEHSDPRKVKIDFSATMTGSNAPDNGGSTSAYGSRPGHDGMRDIGPPGGGNRVLLLRGLNYHSTPEHVSFRIGEEIAKLVGRPGQSKEAQKAISRIVRIVDKSARISWGYCFVELATAELATAMLSFLISPQTQPHGFQISEFPVATSFANIGAFIPTPAGPLGGEMVVRAARNGGLGSTTIDKPDGTWVGYWHPDATPQTHSPTGAPTINEDGHPEDLATEFKAFLGSFGGVRAPDSTSIADSRQSQLAAPAGPISITMTAMQPIKIGKSKTPDEGFVAPGTKNILQDDEEVDQIGRDTVLLSRTKGVPNIIGPSTRKVAKDISKWNNKKTELQVPPASTSTPRGLSDANAAMGPSRIPAKTATPIKAPETFDYSNLAENGKAACLLCQRQFKSEEEVKKHTALSDLHKTNLLDSALCEAGRQRKAAAEGKDQPRYRDRAAERREVHHQPVKPAREESSVPTRKFAEGPKPAPPPPAPALEPGKDDSNRGNQLLAKMGWKTGVGLGTSGDGRVDPIMVQQFENRAGLGASKGHDATKWQGPGGFQNRAKDMTQERFEQMSQQPK